MPPEVGVISYNPYVDLLLWAKNGKLPGLSKAEIEEAGRIYDRLAKGLNGRGSSVLLASLVRAAGRSAFPPQLFVIDVNTFGPLNNTYGHKIGDFFLESEEKAIREFFKARGIEVEVSRNGISFVVVARGINAQRAAALQPKLNAHLSAQNFEVFINPKNIPSESARKSFLKYVQKKGIQRTGNGFRVSLKEAPVFNRHGERVDLARFTTGLLQGTQKFPSQDYGQAVERVISLMKQRKPGNHVFVDAEFMEIPAQVRTERISPSPVEIENFRRMLKDPRIANAIFRTPEEMMRAMRQAGIEPNPAVLQLNREFNFDTRAGVRSEAFFNLRLEGLHQAKTPYTLVYLDLKAFGGWNYTYNQGSSTLGTYLGDVMMEDLCLRANRLLVSSGVNAGLHRVGGDELALLGKATPQEIETFLKKLEAELQGARKLVEVDVSRAAPQVRAFLEAQGIKPNAQGKYVIDLYKVIRHSLKYPGRSFIGMLFSAGIVRVDDFKISHGERCRQADGLAERAKNEGKLFLVDKRSEAREAREATVAKKREITKKRAQAKQARAELADLKGRATEGCAIDPETQAEINRFLENDFAQDALNLSAEELAKKYNLTVPEARALKSRIGNLEILLVDAEILDAEVREAEKAQRTKEAERTKAAEKPKNAEEILEPKLKEIDQAARAKATEAAEKARTQAIEAKKRVWQLFRDKKIDAAERGRRLQQIENNYQAGITELTREIYEREFVKMASEQVEIEIKERKARFKQIKAELKILPKKDPVFSADREALKAEGEKLKIEVKYLKQQKTGLTAKIKAFSRSHAAVFGLIFAMETYALISAGKNPLSAEALEDYTRAAGVLALYSTGDRGIQQLYGLFAKDPEVALLKNPQIAGRLAGITGATIGMFLAYMRNIDRMGVKASPENNLAGLSEVTLEGINGYIAMRLGARFASNPLLALGVIIGSFTALHLVESGLGIEDFIKGLKTEGDFKDLLKDKGIKLKIGSDKGQDRFFKPNIPITTPDGEEFKVSASQLLANTLTNIRPTVNGIFFDQPLIYEMDVPDYDCLSDPVLRDNIFAAVYRYKKHSPYNSFKVKVVRKPREVATDHLGRALVETGGYVIKVTGCRYEEALVAHQPFGGPQEAVSSASLVENPETPKKDGSVKTWPTYGWTEYHAPTAMFYQDPDTIAKVEFVQANRDKLDLATYVALGLDINLQDIVINPNLAGSLQEALGSLGYRTVPTQEETELWQATLARNNLKAKPEHVAVWNALIAFLYDEGHISLREKESMTLPHWEPQEVSFDVSSEIAFGGFGAFKKTSASDPNNFLRKKPGADEYLKKTNTIPYIKILKWQQAATLLRQSDHSLPQELSKNMPFDEFQDQIVGLGGELGEQ